MLAKFLSSTGSRIGAALRKRGRSFSPCAPSRSIPTGNMAATPSSTPSPSTAGRRGSMIGSTPRFQANPMSWPSRISTTETSIRLIEERPQADRPEPSLSLRSPQRRVRVRLLPGARRQRRVRYFVAHAGRRGAKRGRGFLRHSRERHSFLAGEDRAAQESRSATGKSATPSRRRRRLSSSMPRDTPSSPVLAITTAPGFATAPRRRSPCSGPG